MVHVRDATDAQRVAAQNLWHIACPPVLGQGLTALQGGQDRAQAGRRPTPDSEAPFEALLDEGLGLEPIAVPVQDEVQTNPLPVPTEGAVPGRDQVQAGVAGRTPDANATTGIGSGWSHALAREF